MFYVAEFVHFVTDGHEMLQSIILRGAGKEKYIQIMHLYIIYSTLLTHNLSNLYGNILNVVI